jgi:hypothetical protein
LWAWFSQAPPIVQWPIEALPPLGNRFFLFHFDVTFSHSGDRIFTHVRAATSALWDASVPFAIVTSLSKCALANAPFPLKR